MSSALPFEKPPVILIINTSPDVVEMLRIAFEHAGIVAVGTFTHAVRGGEVDLEALVRQHAPKVVVYDIAPPYPNNWLFFQHTAHLPAMAGRTFNNYEPCTCSEARPWVRPANFRNCRSSV